MEKEEIRELLPRQRKGVVVEPMNLRPTNFYSNIFEIRLKESSMVIYQYSFDFSP